MGEILLIMQVEKAIQQLLHNAFNLGHCELYLFVSHPGKVEIEVVEEEEVAASHFIFHTR